MGVLHPDCPLQSRPFDHDPGLPVADMDSDGFARKMEPRARRAGMTPGDCVALMKAMWDRRPEVPSVIAGAGARAREAGAPMLSHDDTQPVTRDFYRGHGARISEFPMNVTVTSAAREAGDWIVFGAPNAGAADMVAAGLCDILASDYYYPAMLAAVARLRADGVSPLPDLWGLVAANPAAALGLGDRGTVAPGQRADLVLIEWPEGAPPAVRMCLSGGRAAYAAMAAG
jgi:alpha-D-ribose 1-methylphosphonate 5-triphosphate diphosphatase